MSVKVRKAGAWVDTSTVKVRKAGAWATASFVKAMKAGAWVTVWPVVSAALAGGSVFASGPGAESIGRYTLTSGGLEQSKAGSSGYTTLGTWLTAGSAGDYEARVSGADSASLLGSAVGSWLNLATTREWTYQEAFGGGGATKTFTVEIRDVATSTVRATASMSITSENL